MNEKWVKFVKHAQRMGRHCRMKYQGLYLGSPCKDSWFEVDWWVIKIMNALEWPSLWREPVEVLS
jgi:hypothetical protein